MRIPAFIVTLSGMLVFRGLTLIVLNGLTIAPFPPAYLGYSTGFVPDAFARLELFGVRNTTSLLVGILIAIVYCIIQVMGYLGRKNKGYAVESVWTLILKMAIISPLVVWLF
ncbi:MAG TPA: ABC transporter permease, partial [Firmicutes bacterium]|nr:ABC transporter permease [Bacillota bacterium]